MAVKPIKTASDRAPSAIEHLFHQCNKDPIVGRPSPASYHKWPLARKLPMATRHTRHYHPELPEPDVFKRRRTWNTACDGHTNIGEITIIIYICVCVDLCANSHAWCIGNVHNLYNLKAIWNLSSGIYFAKVPVGM